MVPGGRWIASESWDRTDYCKFPQDWFPSPCSWGLGHLAISVGWGDVFWEERPGWKKDVDFPVFYRLLHWTRECRCSERCMWASGNVKPLDVSLTEDWAKPCWWPYSTSHTGPGATEHVDSSRCRRHLPPGHVAPLPLFKCSRKTEIKYFHSKKKKKTYETWCRLKFLPWITWDCRGPVGWASCSKAVLLFRPWMLPSSQIASGFCPSKSLT